MIRYRPTAARPFTRRLPHTLGLGAVGLLASLSLATPALADKSPHELRVQANTTLSVAPDTATLDARLWERTPAQAQGSETSGDAAALKQARERLEQRTGELIRTLEKAGIPRDAIRAGSLSVRPDYIASPQRGDDAQPPQVRTQLERPITLTLDDLDRLPRVLDALTTAGVDALDGVTYGLKDSDAADDRALAQALERARDKAKLMAKTLDVDLGDVISVEETTAPSFKPQMMTMRAAAENSAGSAPEYRSGEIDIDAGVNVTWSIDD